MSEQLETDRTAELLIGRSLLPDEQEMISAAGMDAATGILHLRSFLEQTHQLHMDRTRFRFAPDGVARLVIIGEHAVGVARALASRCELPVIGRVHPPHVPEWWDDLQEEAGNDADYLILEGRIANGQTVSAARELGLRTIRMQAVAFSGLHPDAIPLPKLPLSSPGLGGWHSALIVDAVLNDIRPDACRARFSADTYAQFGYFDRYERDMNAMYARDSRYDAPIAGLFADSIRHRPLLRNPLDGSPLLFDLYVEALAPLLGLKPSNREALGTESATGLAWPIMPELAAFHRIDYSTPLLFGRETEALGLEELIQRCYDSYQWWSRELLVGLFGTALRERNL